MKQLTIWHLAPYLPYGLKFMPTHYNYEKGPYTLSYMSKIHDSDEFGVNGYTSNYIKPLLRPLSQLTQEITHNGETFVPIVELFNVRYEKNSYHILGFESNKHIHKLMLSWDDKKAYTTDFFYNEEKQSFHIVQYGKHKSVTHQLRMFKKLYEWHFDLDRLIDAGLALPIND